MSVRWTGKKHDFQVETSKKLITFFQHADFQTLHEAAGLTGLASSLRDLTFVGGRTAVLYVT